MMLCSILMTGFFSCTSKKDKKAAIFTVLTNEATGLNFSNNLEYNQAFNLFKYIYFYNGSGVGAGDFNNDGFVDLFFGSNQGNNTLYLNQGGLKFQDVTSEARIPADGGWSTGIAVADINNDGLLDIYVCRVGNYEVLKGKNQLLICKGITEGGVPFYEDEAAAFGLDFSGFSTQAAFLDYDQDGDLDMFLMNHSVHENGTFRPRNDFLNTFHPLSGDRLYRNDLVPSPDGKRYEGRFTDVTRHSGINSSAIGYGLGIAVSDINLDGYPDIYIGNDFHENDYLYINQRNGTFKDESESQLMHTSQFSMGVDVADVNNDAYPEIISVDMLPFDPYILKRSLGEDKYDIFRHKVSVGYSHQYTRNNLQLNRRNGMFSEIGLLSGVAATDWSWAPLWFDFDNDGLKDLFISNGIPKRMNDIDYINFVTNTEVQKKIRENNMQDKDLALISNFPEIKLHDKFYLNKGDLTFSDEAQYIDGAKPAFSNGAVYADFDNDGDLDIVVNTINEPAILYRNNTAASKERSAHRVILKGPPANVNAVGARLLVYSDGNLKTYEKYPVKGFLSAMEVPLQFGVKGQQVDSVTLIWPDNTYQHVAYDSNQVTSSLTYQPGLPVFNFSVLHNSDDAVAYSFRDITEATGIDFIHRENQFIEFDREPLIPHMLSTEGPALAVSDINQDGLEDFFIGASRNKIPAVYVQLPGGTFKPLKQPALEMDSAYEDIDAAWADMNNDGHPDLLVASGGNEFYGKAWQNTPRLYLNDGKGNLTRQQGVFTNLYMTASTIRPADINGDGYSDLFIGGRTVPWGYGQAPASYLLLNNKDGSFSNVTDQLAPGLSSIGMVTSATWADMNQDKLPDLLVSLEWGGVFIFQNQNGKFKMQSVTQNNGWWNFILPSDVDNDGDMDILAGNLGLNSRLTATADQPVRLYYNDYDDNGTKEQVVTYYLSGREIPFANKAELEKQVPQLKKKYLYAEDFAKASLPDLFTNDKLKNAGNLKADYFYNAIFINDGTGAFEARPLPVYAQFSPLKAAVKLDAAQGGLPDFLIAGNYYDNNIQMGRNDADYGTLLLNKGNGHFSAQSLKGLQIKGQVRRICQIQVGEKTALILAKNNDKLQVIAMQ